MAMSILMPSKYENESAILKFLDEAWNTEKGVFYTTEFLCRLVKKYGVDALRQSNLNSASDAEGAIVRHLKEMYPAMNTRCLKYALYFILWRGKMEVEHSIMEPAFEKFAKTYKPASAYEKTPDLRRALFTPPHPRAQEFTDAWKTFLRLTGYSKERAADVAGAPYARLKAWAYGLAQARDNKFERAIANLQEANRKIMEQGL